MSKLQLNKVTILEEDYDLQIYKDGTEQYCCDTEGDIRIKELAIRWIVAEKTCLMIDGILLDMFTASGLVQIIDGLNDENRAKYLALPLSRMANILWQITK